MMEASRARIGSSQDTENMVARKPITKPSTITTKRQILSEVGNKTQVAKPQNVVKKQPVVNKEPLKSSTIVTKKAIAIEAKPKCIKRQESTLMQRFKEITASASIPTQLSYSSRQLNDVIDIDAQEEDPSMVSEYIKDIVKYLLHLEEKYPIQQGFLTPDHASTIKMRYVLVNWMSEVQLNFKLLIETFHLSVTILDRYLQKNKKVGRETLQLVGTGALFVACKYEELYCPDLSDFVYICDDSFTKKQVLVMEIEILKAIGYNINRPLSIQFLRRYSMVAKASPLVHTLGKYLLELGIFDYNMCHVKPSLQAAAACCLSIAILNDKSPSSVWSKLLSHYSSYSYNDIKETVYDFAALILKMEKSKYQAIRKKYSSSSCGKISMHAKLNGIMVKKYALQSKNITQ